MTQPAPAVFAFTRANEQGRLLVLANFTERAQSVETSTLRLHGVGYHFHDLLSDRTITSERDLSLYLYQVMWLVA